jgi:hypothetical protein
MEDDGDYTQISISQRMADKPCTTMRSYRNYSTSERSSGKVL